jgi:UDP-glucose 4-epimerase
MRVLVLGAAGALARELCLTLVGRGHEVVGMDARPWTGAAPPMEFHQVDVRKRGAEDVFRRKRPEVVVHMATVTSLVAEGAERARINLDGTRAVVDYCQAHSVRRMVFVGRHTFYGAASDSPLYHTESEPPRALDTFPELADLVAADLYAATALWRVPEMTTTLLRLCYTLGTPGSGTLANLLRARRVPTVLGYDPLFQVLQDSDAVRAITLAVEQSLRGIFNVAGPSPLPLSVILRETGRPHWPLPLSVLRQLIGRFGLPRLPMGALTHLMFPIVVDSSVFARLTGFAPKHDELEILRLFKESLR